MLTEFGQILTFVILAVVFVFVGLVVSRIIQPRKPSKEKSTTYECGEVPIGDSWIRFNIRFYVIALVFVIFDVEAVFLFPWAVVFKKMGVLSIVEMFIFLLILFAGFIYLWARGDLEWIRPRPVIPEIERKIIKETKEETKQVEMGHV